MFKKFLTTLAVAVTMMGATLTPQQQLRRVETVTGIKTNHIAIYATQLPYGVKGVACGPFLILTSQSDWEADNNWKNYIHVMHEVGHTYGAFHHNSRIRAQY